MTRRSRRSMLAVCGAGLAALAGCSADFEVDDDDEREYDARALRDVVEGRKGQTRPDAFPVRVGEETLGRHYDRARELVAAVPERPEVPNGAVTEELRRRRERVVDDLDGPRDAATGRRRLDAARRVRGEAAEVNGAYHAAVGEVDRASVEEHRRTLRRDLHAFEAEWDYRGADPAGALVVHGELERLLRAVQRNAEAWPPFPAEPVADVFRVGEIAGKLETGWATLGDADRLRTRYLDGMTDPRSFRAAFTAATYRLGRRTAMERRRVGEFLELEATELPFDRSIEGTPAALLYEEARRNVRTATDDVELFHRTGEPATATLRSATKSASFRTFDAVVDAIEAGEYGPPEDVGRVETAHEGAITALRTAWETDPIVVSVEVSDPAHEAFTGGHYRLEGIDGHEYEVHDALAEFAYARLYAERVPAVVADVVDALDGDG